MYGFQGRHHLSDDSRPGYGSAVCPTACHYTYTLSANDSGVCFAPGRCQSIALDAVMDGQAWKTVNFTQAKTHHPHALYSSRARSHLYLYIQLANGQPTVNCHATSHTNTTRLTLVGLLVDRRGVQYTSQTGTPERTIAIPFKGRDLIAIIFIRCTHFQTTRQWAL